MKIELAGLSPGNEYDQLLISGNATISGTLTVNKINGYIPSLSDSFNIVKYATASGHFGATLIAGTDRAAKDLSLSHFDEIGGTGFLYAELGAYSESAGKGFSSGGASRITHNLLFFSTAAKTAHWLLPSNDQTILSFHFLSDPPRPQYKDYEGQSPRPEQVTVAILVEIAEGAQTPDVPSRLRALGIASADGRGFTTVSRSINELLGYHQMGKDSVLIFYVSDGQAKVMDLDPMARKVRSDDPLSMQ